MDNWDEVRTAFQVARVGTVSGAAEVLGVHHATVIRHIDALERRLGTKLFQRHARGYTTTEAGKDLMQVAQATDDQLSQLAGRIRGQGEGVSGELVVTSLNAHSELLTPVLISFQQENPGVVVRYLTGARLFRLEYGEAHVALRAGSPPQEPDNVVQPFISQTMVMVATEDYLNRHGTPESEADLARHQFVGPDDADTRAPHGRWLSARVGRERITFRTQDDKSNKDAILAGAGIGFLPVWEVEAEPRLRRLLPGVAEISADLWLVTHVDLHRTPKVQAFLTHLKAAAKAWTFP